jgi:hypothetical protein
MGNIAKTDITVTLAPGDSYNPPGMPLVSFPSLAFGDGVLQYPTYGIPLPDMGKLGAFKKAIKRILITPAPGDGYIYKYDKNYGTIRVYQVAADAGAVGIVAASAGTPAGNVAAPTGNVAAPALTVAAPTANLHSGTVAANAVSNLAVDVAAPTGNLANTALTLQAPAFTGAALGTHTHGVTGGTGVAAGMAELVAGVVVPTAVLDLMVIGE